MVILIADAHAMIRRSVQLQLADLFPQATYIHCDSLASLEQTLTQHAADLLIMALLLALPDYRSVIQRIRRCYPTLRLLIFTSLDEQRHALPALQAGADGYLSKQASEAEFLRAVQALWQGQTYVSETIDQRLKKRLNTTRPFIPDPLESLSTGEQKVLEGLLAGKYTKEIAADLNLKQNTVSTVKKRIFQKFEVSSLVELLEKINPHS
ncbi:LuxR C-terminal-related transcriptional regulator [Spirosoma koreense]